MNLLQAPCNVAKSQGVWGVKLEELLSQALILSTLSCPDVLDCFCSHNRKPEVGQFIRSRNQFLTLLKSEMAKIKALATDEGLLSLP